MKKLLILCLLSVCFTVALNTAFAAESTILINGTEAHIAPEMGSVKNFSDRTFVPVRFVLEYFGFSVTWDSNEQLVLGRNSGGDVFLMQVSNPVLAVKYADGSLKNIEMDVSPVLVPEEGRTYIPVRFLAQAIGYQVGYDDLTGTVMLDK